jgi:hypothetical protein
MGELRARNLAVTFVADCISACEAEGYQQSEKSDWYQEGPTCGELRRSGFVVAIGGHRIKFSATIAAGENARKTCFRKETR